MSRKELLNKKRDKKNKFYVTILIFVLSLILLVFSLYSIQKNSNRNIFAVVNGREITEQDIKEIFIAIPHTLRANITNDMLVEQAINMEIVVQESKKLGINVTDEEVESEIKSAIEKIGLKEEDFFSLVRMQEGADKKTFKNAYKKQLLALKFVNQTIISKILVDEKEVREAYSTYLIQYNVSYDDVKDDLKRALEIKKAQFALEIYLNQKRKEYNITRFV
ncbi:MAG: SurA N-terminal domain-containing protein [Candidatus Woesearchaeota archaeon]